MQVASIFGLVVDSALVEGSSTLGNLFGWVYLVGEDGRWTIRHLFLMRLGHFLLLVLQRPFKVFLFMLQSV